MRVLDSLPAVRQLYNMQRKFERVVKSSWVIQNRNAHCEGLWRGLWGDFWNSGPVQYQLF